MLTTGSQNLNSKGKTWPSSPPPPKKKNAQKQTSRTDSQTNKKKRKKRKTITSLFTCSSNEIICKPLGNHPDKKSNILSFFKLSIWINAIELATYVV